MGLDIDITKNISQNESLIESKEIYYSDFFPTMFWFDKRLDLKEDEFSKEIPSEVIFELHDILQKIENLENSKKKNALKKAKFLFYHDNLKHDHPKDIAEVHHLLTSLIAETKFLKSQQNSKKKVSYIYTRTD